MTEMLPTPEALWFKGPNYTADAVIIDETNQNILLIQRRSGQWALPGGFIDEGESSYAAAQREAMEESTISVMDGQLVFSGIVDDPRNTDESWIETDAYLFSVSSDIPIRSGSDAINAQWHPIDAMPPLYASHQNIIDRAVDYLQSAKRLTKFPADITPVAVDGGHMNYSKNIIFFSDQSVFIKSYIGVGNPNTHIPALYKEAAIMGHLRTSRYPHLPAFSHLAETDLFMEALPPEQGWHWRAPKEFLDAYIRDCLTAFAELERMPLPADTTNVPSTIHAHHEEGWRALTGERFDVLTQFVSDQKQSLRPGSRATAERLFENFSKLQNTATKNVPPDSYVLCHHDARQANIAWHHEHGMRMVDWSWADIGRPGSDATMLLIDLHKHGHDVSIYHPAVSRDHCITLIGFWLYQASQPVGKRDPSVRLHQLVSALAAYEVLEACGSGVCL